MPGPNRGEVWLADLVGAGREDTALLGAERPTGTRGPGAHYACAAHDVGAGDAIRGVSTQIVSQGRGV